ncbi:MAG: cyclopropane-fatty-acyl-phospholipid synthase family protein [Thermoanaerobaculia bacterium]
MTMNLDRFLETGMVPDFMIRIGIRKLTAQRIADEDPSTEHGRAETLRAHVEMLRNSPLAVATEAANDQHYEVPAEFYRLVLGPHLKYSCALWADGVRSLADAEEAMLRLTCERAELEDGQRILELGCGWGSLSLWMAQRYPASRITAVSNSRSQKEWIDARAAERGIGNLEVITCDMRHLALDRTFDRVVSVEMFEHMRNYEELLRRVSTWLEPGGKLFVHVFSHAHVPYLFLDNGPSDWMSRYFFTGGQMPSNDLLPQFQRDLRLAAHHVIDGTHYSWTAAAWLQNMDTHAAEVRRIFAQTYGERQTTRFFTYWRIFFMAVEEVWGWRGGREWLVSHYLFEKPAAR